MKICMNFRAGGRYNNEIEEFNVVLSNESKVTLFIDFLSGELVKEQKINVDITKFENITDTVFTLFKEIAKKFKNVSFIINKSQREYAATFYELNIPYFFNVVATDWDTVHSLKKLGVAEMYVGEDLCFNLDKVVSVVKQDNIKLRTYANIAQIKNEFGNADTLKSFFIRPEDLDLYEEIFDSIEFAGPVDRQDVLYKIYRIDRKWSGDLRQIIIGLKEELDSRFLIPFFAVKRVNCNRKCMKGSSCKICERTRDLITEMQEAGLEIKKNEDKHE